MPMQILVTKLTRDEVKNAILKLEASEILDIVDPPGPKSTCIVRAKTKMNAPMNERSQAMMLLQKIADADSKRVQEIVAKRQAERKAKAEAEKATAEAKKNTPNL
jgi:hypothetical protein